MKRYGAIFLALLLLALTACGGGEAAATRGTAGSAGSVAQLMESATQNGGTEPPLPPSAASELLPSADEKTPAADGETDALSPEPPGADGVDVDLTQMNATMVFAEVSNLMFDPDPYVGKVIRMRGMAVSSTDPDSGATYHAVIIRDATACCASGLDYVLTEGQAYPPDEAEVTVTGEFELYEEDDLLYCRLRDATLDA